MQIRIRNLSKSYGKSIALDNISLTIERVCSVCWGRTGRERAP